MLYPHEAALLAGIVASPSAYDPTQHPVAAQKRRDLVLQRMFEQGYIPRDVYESGKAEAVPTRYDLTYPKEDTKFPYFTSWVKQQVVDQLGGGQQGARLAFDGGLRVKTTIDSKLQTAAQKAIKEWLPNEGGPQASLVAISNKDGMVRAMVGGDDQRYAAQPFNLATQGQRQPGSAFKPFVLARALERGHQPELDVGVEEADLHPQGWRALHRQQLRRRVRRITDAGPRHDVLRQRRVRAGGEGDRHEGRVEARPRGRHPHQGVHEPRDRARRPEPRRHAARHGARVRDVRDRRPAHHRHAVPGPERQELPVPGPVGIERIDQGKGKKAKIVETVDGRRMVNKRDRTRVMDEGVASQVSQILQTVVKDGTAERAQIPGVMVAGKTGTTESYGDAWFVGWTKEYTVAVWVGYPDEFKPMETEFQGEPVAGGTFPAGDLEELHDVAAEDRPAAQGRRRRRPRRAFPDAGQHLAGHGDRRAHRGAADRRGRDRGSADRHGAAADRDGTPGSDPRAHGAADGHRAATRGLGGTGGAAAADRRHRRRRAPAERGNDAPQASRNRRCWDHRPRQRRAADQPDRRHRRTARATSGAARRGSRAARDARRPGTPRRRTATGAQRPW